MSVSNKTRLTCLEVLLEDFAIVVCVYSCNKCINLIRICKQVYLELSVHQVSKVLG